MKKFDQRMKVFSVSLTVEKSATREVSGHCRASRARNANLQPRRACRERRESLPRAARLRRDALDLRAGGRARRDAFKHSGICLTPRLRRRDGVI
jgi:hypothetical protein